MSQQYISYSSRNSGGSGGVTSLNGQTGALTLVAGPNITITPGAGTLTISSTGGGTSALTQNHIFVGDASNLAADVAMSGEATIVSSGALTLSNAAVIAKVLTGYVAAPGTVSAADSILSAIQKIDGNTAGKLSSALTSAHIFVGNGSNVATDVAVSGELSADNAGAFTLSNAAVIAKVLTGFVSGAGVVSATDSILTAIEKIDGNTSALGLPLQNTLFVSKNGNDGTGNGSIDKPYLTITAAQATIVTASPTNPFVILIAPGDYQENTLNFIPNVFYAGFVGAGSLNRPVRILSTGTITLPLDGASGTGARCGFKNLVFLPTQLIFTRSATIGAAPIVEISECQLASPVVLNGNAADSFQLGVRLVNNSKLLSTCAIHSSTVLLRDMTIRGAMTTDGDSRLHLDGVWVQAGGGSISSTGTSDFIEIYTTGFDGSFNVSGGAATSLSVTGASASLVIDAASYTSGQSGASITIGGTVTLGLVSSALAIHYAPTTPADWPVVPTTVQEALDDLAASSTGSLTDTPNTFAGYDATGALHKIPNWSFDPTTFGMQVGLTKTLSVGPTGSIINYLNVDIVPVPSSSDYTTMIGYNMVFDPANTGEDNASTQEIISVHNFMNGDGVLGQMRAMSLLQTVGNGSTTGTVTNLDTLAIAANIQAGASIVNYTGINHTFDGSAGTVTGNINPVIINTSSGTLVGGDSTMLSIDENHDTTGSNAILRLQYGGTTVGNSFNRMYGSMNGSTGNNYDEINFQSSGSIGGSYQGLTLSKQGDALGNTEMVRLLDSGDTAVNANIVTMNLTGDVTGESALVNAIRSGTIGGNGYGININDSAAYSNNGWQGVFLNKSGSVNQTATGFELNDSSTSTGKVGIRLNINGNAGSGAVEAISVDTNSATTTANNGRTYGLNINSGGNSINSVWSPTSSIFFEAGNQFVSILNINNGSPLSGTAEIGMSSPMLVIAQDNAVLDPLGLGITSVAYASQISVDNTFTVDRYTGAVSGVSVPPNAGAGGGGTVTEVIGYNAFGIFSGGGAPVTDLNVTNVYGYYIPPTFNTAGFAANAWGLYLDNSVVNNWIGSNLGIGAAASTPSATLEIDGDIIASKTVTDLPLIDAQFSAISDTTVNGSNTIIAVQATSTATVQTGAVNDKALIGINTTVTRGDGTDQGNLSGIVGTENLIFHNTDAAGSTDVVVGVLNLIVTANGAITDLYDFRSSRVPGSGTVANHYGLYLPHDAATPIQNWLSGNNLLGATSFSAPTEALDVDGNARIRNLSSIGVVVNDATGLLSNVVPGTSGNVLTSDGTNWISAPAAASSRYSAAFNATTDWTLNVSVYEITILAATHGRGVDPIIQTFEDSNNTMVFPTIIVDGSGNITLQVTATPDNRYSGKVVIL